MGGVRDGDGWGGLISAQRVGGGDRWHVARRVARGVAFSSFIAGRADVVA